MAIVSKILSATDQLSIMLNSVFNQALPEVFVAQDTAGVDRGSSATGNLYASAVGGVSSSSVALSSNVVINVNAGATGLSGVTKIIYAHFDNPNYYYIYTITISPAEEFTYAGTITITSATITISNVMT